MSERRQPLKDKFIRRRKKSNLIVQNVMDRFLYLQNIILRFAVTKSVNSDFHNYIEHSIGLMLFDHTTTRNRMGRGRGELLLPYPLKVEGGWEVGMHSVAVLSKSFNWILCRSKRNIKHSNDQFFFHLISVHISHNIWLAF